MPLSSGEGSGKPLLPIAPIAKVPRPSKKPKPQLHKIPTGKKRRRKD